MPGSWFPTPGSHPDAGYAMWNVLDILGPVFLIIALGAALRKSGFMSGEMLIQANRLVYWVGLPIVLFQGIAKRSFSAEAAGPLLVGAGGMLACAAAAMVLAIAMRMDRRMLGSFVHVAFRGNLAYVGLAVIASAFPRTAAGENPVAGTAALVMSALMLFYNVLAVIVLSAGRHKNMGATLKHMLVQIAINPLILACVAGAIVALVHEHAGLAVPRVIDKTLTSTGVFASPLALLCVGGALVSTPLRGRIIPATLAAGIKVGVGTAVGVLLAGALGLNADQRAVALIFLACPTAVATYVLTEQLDGDGPLSAAGIVISTLMSAVSLAIVVAMI
ncbi:MAG: AEC family transporter [Planctomycetaceae bacterium]|nr:AEC family transporter [Planctomycetaceae bacterium]